MTMYQDSKRIVALQADISKNIVTINHRCSTTDDHAYADLGSALSNTSWVMRYKMVISGLSSSSSNPNNSYLFAISKTNANNMVDQSLGLKMRIGGGTGYLDFHVSGGTSSQNGGEGYDGSLFSSTTVANGTLYVECIRNGSSFSIRLTTSSDYTGGELDTWSTSGTVEDLRYIKYTNRDDNTSSHVCVSTISDIKIYDGVTSATGTFVRDGTWTASASNKVTVALESNKPTNVQDNSLLVEKDTARRYWFDAESDITPTDLNTPTWTKSTSDLSQTTDYLQWANMTGGTENGYYDIGSGNVSDTKWVLRATLTVSSYSTGTAAHSRWCGLGLSSSSATLTGSQDSINIILRTNTSSDTIAGTRSNGTAVDSQLGTAGISGVTLGNGTFYLEMIRESDSDYKLYVRSGSHTGTLLGTGIYTNASGVTGLQYIKTDRLYSSIANGNFVAKWEDIEFYNNTTSTTTPATWTMPPTHEIDLSSSTGWTQVTNTNSEVTGGELIGLVNSSSTNGDGIWKDSGISFSDTAFVFRCKFQIVAGGGGSGNANTLYFGISDTNGATSPSGARDGFAIAITNYAAAGMLWNYPSGSTWDNADTDLSLTPSATTYYLEIKRTSPTSVTFTFYDDSGFSSVVRTHTQTIASTLNGLKYILVQTWRNGSNNTTKIAVSNIQVWNGVGSIH